MKGRGLRVASLFLGLFVVGLFLPRAAWALPPKEQATAVHVPYGVFVGQTRDILTGQAVAGALVSLKGRDLTTRTDADGRYRLLVPPGTWELVVRAPGYLEMSRVYLRSTVNTTRSEDFDLVLENPTLEQQAAVTELLITPPEQALHEGTEAELVGVSSVPSTIRVLMTDGQVVEMDVDEYLKGVVPWELAPSSPMEALKAQAIAARSYAVTSWNHSAAGANVCTTTHCQVWNNTHFTKTDQAVEATRGMVATYRGSIIRAFFFGYCDGHTRNSEDVWVQALPYCRSVACECGFTKLWGHGVGMCQEGAVAMARQGASFVDILQHYYTGTSVLGAQPTPTPVPAATPTPTPDPIVNLSYPLAEGWNLVSIPISVASAGTTDVLASIAGKYDLAMQYDALEAYSRWKVYDASLTVQTGGLETLDTRYGIWLHATSACTLSLSGPRVAGATDIPLYPGLNLIGYPSLRPRAVGDALASITGKYIRVYTYDAADSEAAWALFDFTIPGAINSLTEMKPGQAYWIEMVQPAVWRVEP